MWSNFVGQLQQGIGAAAEFVMEDDEEKEEEVPQQDDNDDEEVVVDVTQIKEGISSWAKSIQETISNKVTPVKQEKEEKEESHPGRENNKGEDNPTLSAYPALAAEETVPPTSLDSPMHSDHDEVKNEEAVTASEAPTLEVSHPPGVTDTVDDKETIIETKEAEKEIPLDTAEGSRSGESCNTGREGSDLTEEQPTVEGETHNENSAEDTLEAVTTYEEKNPHEAPEEAPVVSVSPPAASEPQVQGVTAGEVVEATEVSSKKATPPLLSSPPVGSTEDGSVTQLLRFQQLHAEELQNSERFRRERDELQSEVEALRQQLQEAEHNLRNATSAEEVALLIDKLGSERQRVKMLVEDKKKLLGQVSELEAKVQQYQEQEVTWREGQVHNTSSASRIIKLEEELERRRDQVQTLQGKLMEEKQVKQRVLSQLDSVNKTHQAALEQARQSSASSTDHYQREVIRLEDELQSLQARFQDRAAQLESDLSAAYRRADEAEAKAREMEYSNAQQNFPSVLRAELEQAIARESRLQADLRSTRLELAAATTKVETLISSLAREKETISYLEDQRAKESTASQARQQELQTEVQQWRERVDSLEGVNRKLSSEVDRLTTALSTALTSSTAALPPTHSTGSMEASFLSETALTPSTADASIELPTATFRPPKASFFPSPLSADSGQGGMRAAEGERSRQRLEKELLRQSVELDRLRKVEAEHAKAKKEFSQLSAKHELLLQMYGEMEERVHSLMEGKGTVGQ